MRNLHTVTRHVHSHQWHTSVLCISSPALISCFFGKNFNRCEVLFYYSFDLCFPRVMLSSFHEPVGHLCIFFLNYPCTLSVQILIGLFLCCWVVWILYFRYEPLIRYDLKTFSLIKVSCLFIFLLLLSFLLLCRNFLVWYSLICLFSLLLPLLLVWDPKHHH